jgi:hypothetical protein
MRRRSIRQGGDLYQVGTMAFPAGRCFVVIDDDEAEIPKFGKVMGAVDPDWSFVP